MRIVRIAWLVFIVTLLVGFAPMNPDSPLPAFETRDFFVHVPRDAAKHQPARVLVALHGVGARGDTFAQPLMEAADRNGWILVAPTMRYRNWMDVAPLWEDDLKYSRMLRATLDALSARVGVRLHPRVMLYGFSRGAQLAHRFALLYPDRVQAVTAISAGSYTLPTENQMPLPLGVADLGSADWTRFRNISFWIAVGEKDTRAGDVPRAFDGHGRTRVERARAFHAALKTMGMDAAFAAFPGADHEITPEMLARAVKFLRARADRLPRATQSATFTANAPDPCDGADAAADSSCDDGEPVMLATYQVQGDRIINPQMPALTDATLVAYQKDTAQHQEIWSLFAKIIPPERRTQVSQFVIFRDGRDSTFASVEPDENDPTRWILAVDRAGADDRAVLTETLLHEFGHLLTLNSTQVPPNLATIYAGSPKEFKRAKSACRQYYPGEGCSLPNSYINKFYSRFWLGIEDDWRQLTRDGQAESGLGKFYAKYHDRFVSDYAATDPEEDIAESWTRFVLQPKPNGATIADQKVNFFYGYPELAQLRMQILSRLKAK